MDVDEGGLGIGKEHHAVARHDQVSGKRRIAPAAGIGLDKAHIAQGRAARLRHFNQIVRNIPAFYSTFGITEADALWLDEDQRVAIW